MRERDKQIIIKTTLHTHTHTHTHTFGSDHLTKILSISQSPKTQNFIN